MRTTARVALTVAVLLGAAACGSDDEGDFADSSVQEIQDAAMADMLAASSLRLTGTVPNGELEQRVDVALNDEGECRGTIELGGGTAELAQSPDGAFFKGDQAFWEASLGDPNQAQTIVGLLGDKWAKLPTEGAVALSGVCDLEELLDGLNDDESAENTEKGEIGDVDGVPAIELVTEKEDRTTSAWIALDAPHHILRLASPDGDTPLGVSFSDFGGNPDLAAPPEDEVIDLSQAR